MAHRGHETSFFEELEAAAKGLSVAASDDKVKDLRRLFDDLKDLFQEGNEVQPAASNETIDSTYSERDRDA